jgi:hypothetical protein
MTCHAESVNLLVRAVKKFVVRSVARLLIAVALELMLIKY